MKSHPLGSAGKFSFPVSQEGKKAPIPQWESKNFAGKVIFLAISLG
jgi:hypothetical protein